MLSLIWNIYCLIAFLVRVFFSLPQLIYLETSILLKCSNLNNKCLILFFKPAFARLSSRTRCTLCPVKIISHLLISLLAKKYSPFFLKDQSTISLLSTYKHCAPWKVLFSLQMMIMAAGEIKSAGSLSPSCPSSGTLCPQF